MNFLIIPEDFRKDQYILLPILRKLLIALQFPNPKVEVCKDPLLGGVTEALKKERLSEIFERYSGMVDIFVLCVDRDAETGRAAKLSSLEEHFRGHISLIASQAWEELETWLLAGLDLPAEWRWTEVRSSNDVKEAFFEPLSKLLRLTSEPGGGRRTLGLTASSKIPRIRQLCPEDFDDLACRLASLRR